MADLIDRETVRLTYEKSLENDNHRIEGASAIHKQEHRHMLHILDKIPAVDAVEVVRCKNCKHNPDYEVKAKNMVWCRQWRAYVSNTGFCSEGERRSP